VADEPVFGEFADGADAKCLLEGGRVAASQPNASSGTSASASSPSAGTSWPPAP